MALSKRYGKSVKCSLVKCGKLVLLVFEGVHKLACGTSTFGACIEAGFANVVDGKSACVSCSTRCLQVCSGASFHWGLLAWFRGMCHF